MPFETSYATQTRGQVLRSVSEREAHLFRGGLVLYRLRVVIRVVGNYAELFTDAPRGVELETTAPLGDPGKIRDRTGLDEQGGVEQRDVVLPNVVSGGGSEKPPVEDFELDPSLVLNTGLGIEQVPFSVHGSHELRQERLRHACEQKRLIHQLEADTEASGQLVRFDVRLHDGIPLTLSERRIVASTDQQLQPSIVEHRDLILEIDGGPTIVASDDLQRLGWLEEGS